MGVKKKVGDDEIANHVNVLRNTMSLQIDTDISSLSDIDMEMGESSEGEGEIPPQKIQLQG